MRPGFNPRRFNLGAYNKARAKTFEELYIPEPNSGCWIWIGPLNMHGYGNWKKDGKDLGAHRVSWTQTYGNPGSSWVLHRCDNRACVNPDHLFLGNSASNVADKMAKGRHRVVRGEKHGAAKLKEQDVIAIRQDGRTVTELAKHYNVSVSLICNIKSRIAWRHVP